MTKRISKLTSNNEPTKDNTVKSVKRLRKIVFHLREHNITDPVLKTYEKALEKAEKKLKKIEERSVKEL